jgi:hypothetical protein
VQMGRDLRRRDRAMSAIAQGALGMTVVGDPTPTTSPYKPALRLPAGNLVPIRLATPIVRPIVALPPVYTPVVTTPPASAATTPAPPAPVAPTPVTTIRVAPPTVSGGSGLPITAGMSPIIASIPNLTEVTSGQEDHTTRNVVLVAGAAGALAYFLFFRRRT